MKNSLVWYIASGLFLVAALASLIGEQTTYALGFLALTFAFLAIAYSAKNKNPRV